MYLGLDFGTCNSSAGIINHGKLQMVKDPVNLSYSIPSSVYLTEREILVGHAAENQRRMNPNRYRREFKRNLGENTHILLGDQKFLPEALVTVLLRKLKSEAEEMVNKLLNKVVITVPATYQEHKRNLMLKVAKNAGFLQTKILQEPVAAAIYYAEYYTHKEGEKILVYDLGGGTFDATLLERKGSEYKLLAPPVGDNRCGGIDFDRKIYQDYLSKAEENIKEVLNLKSKEGRRKALTARLQLADFCRNFKHQLSEVEEYQNNPFEFLSDRYYSLSRKEFNNLIADIIAKTIDSCDRLIRDTGLRWKEVDRILLAGGSCRIPYIKEELARKFQREILPADDLELVICGGSVIYSNKLELTPQNPVDPIINRDLENIKEIFRYKDSDPSNRDIEVKLTIPLEKAYSGGRETIRLEDGSSFEVEIPPATIDGQTLCLRGKGIEKSDLYLKIIVTPHPFLKLRGADIHTQKQITYSEALLAREIEVQTIDGIVKMKLPSRVRSGQKLRLTGKGYPRRDGTHGDQLVEICVEGNQKFSPGEKIPDILLEHTKPVISVAISPDGEKLVSASDDKTIKIWNLTTKEVERTIRGLGSSLVIAISPNGQKLAVGSNDKTIKIWDLSNGKRERVIKGHKEKINGLVFKNSRILVSYSNDGIIKVWDTSEGILHRNLEAHTESVFASAISADGEILISGSSDRTIRIWDLNNGTNKSSIFAEHQASIRALSINGEQTIVASGGYGNNINLWDLKTKRLINELTGYTGHIEALVFSPDGNTLFSGSRDRNIYIWDVCAMKLKDTLTGHNDSVLSLDLSPDGTILASSSKDKTIRIWSL